MACGWQPQWITALQTWISGGRWPLHFSCSLFCYHSNNLFFRFSDGLWTRTPPPPRRYVAVTSFYFELNALLQISELKGEGSCEKCLLLKNLTKRRKKNSFTGTAVHYDRKNLLEQIQSKVMKIPVAIITGAASGLGAAVSILLFLNERKGPISRPFSPTPVTDCKEVLWRRDARGDHWHQWRERKEEGRGASGPLH